MANVYKEMLLLRDAFRELRRKIRYHLDTSPEFMGGEVLSTAIDTDNGDLLVTCQHGVGDRAVTRTHRITITTEETTT